MINTLCARSLIHVAAGYMPLAISLIVLDHFVHLPKEGIASGFAAIGGGLAWLAPASYRPGSRIN